MRNAIFVICCFFVFQLSTFASIEVTKTYKHTHINVSLYFNHDFIDKELWYYDAVSQLLNSYIYKKIKAKEWKRKKIELHLYASTSNRQKIVEFKNNKRKYNIHLKKYAKIADLVKFIHYIHLQNVATLKSDFENINQQTNLKAFKSIINKRVNYVDLSFFQDKSISVFKLDDLQIIYENDKMYYEFYHRKLKKLEADFPEPVRIGSCYVLTSGYTTYIYRHGLRINQAKIKKKEEATRFADYTLEVANDWVNLYMLGRPILSYQLSKNEFCQIKYNPKAAAKIFPSRL
ncbi:MAG: hypothetical protein ACPG5B_01360 [Chitinophagales bacterium]